MVIDPRPTAEVDAVHVAAPCDLLVVPTRPAILDMRAILATLDVVKGAARRSTIVLNACPPPRLTDQRINTTLRIEPARLREQKFAAVEDDKLPGSPASHHAVQAFPAAACS